MSIGDMATQTTAIVMWVSIIFFLIIILVSIFGDEALPLLCCGAALWAVIFITQASHNSPDDQECMASVHDGKLPPSYAARYPKNCDPAGDGAGGVAKEGSK